MSVYRRKTRAGELRWHYRVVVRLPDGNKHRVAGTPSLNTKAAAQAAERAHVERVLRPPPPAVREVPRLRDFAKEFLASHVVINNKPSEQASKRGILDRWILPLLGDLRLDDIGRCEIDKLQAAVLAPRVEGGRPRSRKTANNVLAVLSRTLRYAVEVGELANKPKMGLLKIGEQPFRFLDFDEYAALLKVAAAEPEWNVAVLLAGDTGLRRGELRALEWEHCAVKRGQVHVQGRSGRTRSARRRTVRRGSCR